MQLNHSEIKFVDGNDDQVLKGGIHDPNDLDNPGEQDPSNRRKLNPDDDRDDNENDDNDNENQEDNSEAVEELFGSLADSISDELDGDFGFGDDDTDK